eukprot:CAMPEP_0172175022 /NCGR_PEP_ID=MMETSP1050-20130122/13988_1 /TAXON_ID=233186 /ORGANISM="Cryptomonas curvata, Strain CCAP979/52" /LENGTH=66 /DNA_ID=CAMNT_0012847061 /DNA_START=31 /DNA_END=231 /DNA_ORIENTATION=-
MAEHEALKPPLQTIIAHTRAEREALDRQFPRAEMRPRHVATQLISIFCRFMSALMRGIVTTSSPSS